MLAGERKDQLLQAVEMLLEARRSAPIEDLPAELRPTTMEEVYFIQDNMAVAFGAVGGWKVGAPNPEATPLFASMPLVWIAEDGSTLNGPHHRLRGLEAEIAFLIGSDLPPRSTPYTREEVAAAITSCHPAIEVLETAMVDTKKCDRLTVLADMQTHGGFVAGPAAPQWQQIDFAKETVVLTVDGVVRVEATGSNTAGTDVLRLVVWLANEGAARTGGLKAGNWITTGSWTGNTLATDGSAVKAHFNRAGEVTLRFG